jgi:LAGLIDADG DNA endonuclease family protein
MIKPQIKWTDDKIELLKSEYPLGDTKLLASNLGISYSALKDAARRFGVKSQKSLNKNTLKELLNFEDLQICYWLGFLMADGNINERQVRVSSSLKDYNHLSKLANRFGVDLKIRTIKTVYNSFPTEYCHFAVNDTVTCLELLKIFNIRKGLPKTENPPNISIFTAKDQLLSFFIGFFDGDGCFSKYKSRANFLKLEIHKNWLGQLQEFKKLLNDMEYSSITTGINNRGYAYFKLYRRADLLKLKNFITAKQLPVLQRKWDLVY